MSNLRYLLLLLSTGIVVSILFVPHLASARQENHDDSLIAFAVFQIHTVNSDGANSTQVTNWPPPPARHPSWSPDGKKIAFEAPSFRNEIAGSDQIWVIDLETSEVTQLTEGDENNYLSPAWSPKGDYIAFISENETDADYFHLHLLKPDGSAQIQITAIERSYDATVAWSPDGSKIIFVRDYNLYMIDINDAMTEDREAILLTGNLELCLGLTEYANPTWSVNNQLAVFVNCGSIPDIYVFDINLASSDPLITYSNLTTGNIDRFGGMGIGRGLDWSPDAKRLVLTSVLGVDEPSTLLVIDLDNTGHITDVTPLLEDKYLSPRDPVWQPTG